MKLTTATATATAAEEDDGSSHLLSFWGICCRRTCVRHVRSNICVCCGRNHFRMNFFRNRRRLSFKRGKRRFNFDMMVQYNWSDCGLSKIEKNNNNINCWTNCRDGSCRIPIVIIDWFQFNSINFTQSIGRMAPIQLAKRREITRLPFADARNFTLPIYKETPLFTANRSFTHSHVHPKWPCRFFSVLVENLNFLLFNLSELSIWCVTKECFYSI